MGVRRLVVLAALAAGAAAPLAAQGDRVAPPPAEPVQTLTPTGVRPGDVVNVWVWRERDLTGEFIVDARGRVVLPMLGERMVAGRAADSLADELRTAFQRYLNNPSIQVTVLRRITIGGQVQRPGLYPVDATVTIGGAIALAGGISGSGDPRRVRLMRDGRVLVSAIGPETVLERSPVQSGDVVYVPERPWLSRNLPTVLLGMGSAIVTGVTVAILSHR